MNAARKDITEELHAPVRRNFPRRKVEMRGIDETWQADLIDMQKHAYLNKGFSFLLTVIDNVSKFAWAIPLKNKTGNSLYNALRELFEKRKPKNLHVDQGTEFYNVKVKNLLKNHDINLYSTYSEKKHQLWKDLIVL